MKCPACNIGNLLKTTKRQTYTYKRKSITLNQPGMWCDHCDEGILSGKDIAKTEEAFEEFKAKIDGLLSPEDIRRIRKSLHLTQKEAREMCGIGKNAFTRYEKGKLKPSKLLSNFLKMLERHPEDTKYLKKSSC